jgi:phage/plasmid-associated DNA primase
MFKMILPRQNGKDMRFGVVAHLLPFKDGTVLDLDKVEMRKATRDDLITRHTNTIYEEPSKEALEKMRIIINQILPKTEYYKTYMSVLWSALYGRMPEKIIFAKGHGRNGKSKINTQLMRGILGERTEEGGLYFTGEITTLMGKDKGGGANPAMANLDGMRCAVYGEPPPSAKFSANKIKLMTGQHTINARRLYSNKTKTDIYATYILEVNKLSKMDDDGVSLEDRIIIVPFISYFTDDESKWNEEKHIYPKDINLDVWLDANWNAFLKILMEHAKKMDRKNGINLNQYETPEMRKAVKEYVSRGNDLYQFCSDNYEFTEDRKDTISIKDFKSKYQRITGDKKTTNADFIQMIKDNNLLKDRFLTDSIINGKRVKNMMIMMKEIVEDEEEEEVGKCLI